METGHGGRSVRVRREPALADRPRLPITHGIQEDDAANAVEALNQLGSQNVARLDLDPAGQTHLGKAIRAHLRKS